MALWQRLRSHRARTLQSCGQSCGPVRIPGAKSKPALQIRFPVHTTRASRRLFAGRGKFRPGRLPAFFKISLSTPGAILQPQPPPCDRLVRRGASEAEGLDLVAGVSEAFIRQVQATARRSDFRPCGLLCLAFCFAGLTGQSPWLLTLNRLHPRPRGRNRSTRR